MEGKHLVSKLFIYVGILPMTDMRAHATDKGKETLLLPSKHAGIKMSNLQVNNHSEITKTHNQETHIP
jgi:hypothetical protein